MENNSNKPTLILAVGMLSLLVGGFLFFVYVGNNGRKAENFASRINFRSFSTRISAYYGDLKSGGASLKQKANSFMSSFWEEPAGTASAAKYAEAAKRGGGDEDWSSSGDEGGDSFGKYYNKNYGGNSGSDPSSWVDNSEGGGASFGGGASGEGSSGEFAASPKGASRAKQQRAASGPSLAAASGRPAADLRPGFGGPSAGGAKAAAQRLYASVPARSGGQNAALQYGGGMPASGGRSNNKLNGMSGSQAKGAGDLNGATENMSGGAQSSYNSKLSGGAAAIAGGGGGGGSVPAASGPANVSGGGGPAGGGAAGGPSGFSPGGIYGGAGLADDTSAADDNDLLKSVVTDTQNGTDAKYVSPEEAAADPEEAMLKSGAAAAPDAATKEAAAEDPTDFASLSQERKLEIKKNIHLFIKRIENKFGAMADIKTTSCLSTLDLCDAHGVSGNYLTMTTEKGAKLDLGVKYIKARWRRYTIDFQRSGATTQKP